MNLLPQLGLFPELRWAFPPSAPALKDPPGPAASSTGGSSVPAAADLVPLPPGCTCSRQGSLCASPYSHIVLKAPRLASGKPFPSSCWRAHPQLCGEAFAWLLGAGGWGPSPADPRAQAEGHSAAVGPMVFWPSRAWDSGVIPTATGHQAIRRPQTQGQQARLVLNPGQGPAPVVLSAKSEVLPRGPEGRIEACRTAQGNVAKGGLN